MPKSAAKRSVDDDEQGEATAPAWPEPLRCQVGKYTRRRRICLTTLDEIEKRFVWACLKRRKPALAEMLKNEMPTIEKLRAAFDGKILIDVD